MHTIYKNPLPFTQHALLTVHQLLNPPQIPPMIPDRKHIQQLCNTKLDTSNWHPPKEIQCQARQPHNHPRLCLPWLHGRDSFTGELIHPLGKMHHGSRQLKNKLCLGTRLEWETTRSSPCDIEQCKWTQNAWKRIGSQRHMSPSRSNWGWCLLFPRNKIKCTKLQNQHGHTSNDPIFLAHTPNCVQCLHDHGR